MPKRPDPRFPIPAPEKAEDYVLDLLGGIVRRRPLTGEEAMAQLIRLEEDARRGNPAAQTEFARRLLTDAPDSRKNRRALSLLRKAAARKLPEALHLLGVVMLRGQGLDADPAEGAKLLEEAAYLGSAGAAADLARLCRMGLGRPASDRDALYWYRIAGAKGHTASQREAGLMLRDGRGARADNDEAARWLRAAAQGRDPQAQYELARLHQRRGWAGADPEEAARWLTEAALSGVVEAQYRLGVHYWAGRGGRVDLREAVRWPRRRKRQHASPHHPRRLLPDGLGPRHEPLQCLHAPQVRRQAPRRGRRDHAHRTRAHAHPKREGPRHPPCDDLENP